MSDSLLRQLERAYHQDPNTETEERWHIALRRAGLCNDEPYRQVAFSLEYGSVGTTNILFRVYGPKHVACPICCLKNNTLKVYYNNNYDDQPRQATLRSVAGGVAKLEDNCIKDIGPGNSYTVEWSTSADGITTGDILNIHTKLE